MPERLDDYWARVGPGLDRLIAQGANPVLEAYLHTTIAFMAFTMEELPTRATRNQNLLGTLDPLDVLAFDTVRTAHQSLRILSVAGTAVAARVCFEAACTMRFIAGAGTDAAIYAARYSNWRHVETLLHYRRTEEPLPWHEFLEHANGAAEWLDPDSFHVRDRAHWANEPRFANLFEIARHLGLELLYRQIYGAGSAFVHATSTTSRLYRVGNQLRSVADALHVGRFAFFAAKLALDLHRSFLDFHGVPYHEADLAGLLGRAVAAAQTLEIVP